MRIEEGLITRASGSYGKSVFLSNASGGYVRSKTRHTRSKSILSSRSNNSMRSVSSLWRNVSPHNKLQWQSFCDFEFMPVSNKNSKGMSGYNAFLALNTTILSVVSKYNSSEYRATYSSTPLPFTRFTQVPIFVPPPRSLKANMKTTSGSGCPIRIYNFKVDHNFNTSFQVYPAGFAGSGLILSNLQDAYNRVFGFIIYLSDIVSGMKINPKNQFLNLIGISALANFVPPGLSGLTSFFVRTTCSSLLKYSKSLPYENTKCRYSILSYDVFGCQCLIDEGYTTILSSL